MLKPHLAKSRRSGSRARFDAAPSGPSLSAPCLAKALALALTGVLALSGVAEADSLSQPIWTGRYVGGSLAYASGGDDRVSMLPSGARPGALELSGSEVALQLGFNQQKKALVWGLEGALSFNGIDSSVTDGTITARSEVSRAVSLRARLGLAQGRSLVYATGGLSLADLRYQVSGAGIAIDDSRTSLGYVLGLGYEQAMEGDWSLNATWLYTNYGNATVSDGTERTKATPDFQSIRIGLNHKF